MEDEEYSDDGEIGRQLRLEKMRAQMKQGGGDDSENGGDRDQDMVAEVLDFEDVQGQVSQWIQRTEVTRWIRKTFMHFLRNYKDESSGSSVYEERIRDMCSNNKQSLEITFTHLSSKYPTIAIWLAEEPSLMLPVLNEVSLEVTLELFPDYYMIHSTIFARIKDLPVED